MDISRYIEEEEGGALTPIREGFGEDGGAPYFFIQPIDDDRAEKIQEASKDPDKPYVTRKDKGFRHKRVRNVSDQLVVENMLYEAIVGWDGFQLRHLEQVIPPYRGGKRIKINFHGDDPSTEFPFKEENRRLISKMASNHFVQWVFDIITDMETIHAAQKEDQIKNSESTSAGGATPTESNLSKAS